MRMAFLNGHIEWEYGFITVQKYSSVQLPGLQRKDPIICRSLNLMELGEPAPVNLKAEPAEFCFMLKEMNHLEVVNGLLYRQRHCDHRPVYQFV